MSTKIFVCDMDGTLLNSQGRVSAANQEAVQVLARAGYTVLLASGRHPMLMMEAYRELGLEDLLIGCNGAFIYSPELGTSHFEELPRCTVERVLQLAEPHALDVFLDCDCGMIQLRGSCDILASYSAVPPFTLTSTSDYRLPEEAVRICKIVLAIPDASSRNEALQCQLLEGLQGQMQEIPGLCSVFPGHLLLDIVSDPVNKLTGLRHVVKHADYLVAIGDGENDIPLLEAADFSIAMGNAPLKVQQTAHYVTDHHDADGLAKAICRFYQG